MRLVQITKLCPIIKNNTPKIKICLKPYHQNLSCRSYSSPSSVWKGKWIQPKSASEPNVLSSVYEHDATSGITIPEFLRKDIAQWEHTPALVTRSQLEIDIKQCFIPGMFSHRKEIHTWPNPQKGSKFWHSTPSTRSPTWGRCLPVATKHARICNCSTRRLGGGLRSFHN